MRFLTDKGFGIFFEGASWSYDTPSVSNPNLFPSINHHQLLVVFIIVSDDVQIFCYFLQPNFDSAAQCP